MSDIKILKHDVPVRFGVSREAPPSPENGMIYYDEESGVFKIYENSSWKDLSSRDYANSRVAGFDIKESCRVATTANLSATYANGTGGVGATLTGAGELGSIDGISLSVNDRVLVLNQASASQNGIYKVTALNPFVLTRSTDFDEASEVNGGEFIFIKEGSSYANCAFVCSSSGAATIGSSSITFTQVSGESKSLQNFYAMGNEITTTAGRDVIIAGTEKLEIVSSAGMEVANTLSAGSTILSSATVSNALSIGSANLTVSATGNITKINNVTTSFPSSASQFNYALANNGSGVLSFSNLAVSNLNDITLTSSSSGDLLRYTSSSSSWANKAALATSSTILGSVASYGDINWQGTSFPNGIGDNQTRHVQTFSGLEGFLESITLRIQQPVAQTLYAYIWEFPGISYNYAVGRYKANNGFVATAENALARSNPTAIIVQSGGGGTYSFDIPKFTFANPPLLDKNKEYLFMLNNTQFYGTLNNGGGKFKYNNSSNPPGESWQYVPSGDYFTYIQGAQGWDITWVLKLAGSAEPGLVLSTNSSGFLDASIFKSSFNIGNNIISGVQTPTVSTDLANKAYRDAVSLQTLYTQDQDGGGASISTNATDGSLIIDGTEKLLVSATSGVSISQRLLSSGSMQASSLAVGTGSMSVAASTGNLAKVRGVSYTFPASQSAGTDYVLMNNGSGTLTWTYMQSSYLGRDASVSNIQDDQVLLSSGSVFQNQATVTSGVASKVIITESSGHIDQALLAYNLDFGGYRLTNIGSCVSPSDLASKAYFDGKDIQANDLSSLTLQLLYDQDSDLNNATVMTNSSQGQLHIIGSEYVKVSAIKGLHISDNSDSSKASQITYKHGLSLAASQTATALSALTFSSSLYQGCVIEYRIKDASGDTRVGTLLISTNGLDASIADSFVETSPIGLTWAAAMSGVNVEIRYTSNGNAKDMEATIKLFN